MCRRSLSLPVLQRESSLNVFAKERMNRQVSGMTTKTPHPLSWRDGVSLVMLRRFFFDVRMGCVAVPLSGDIQRDPAGSGLRVMDALNAEPDA